MMARVLTPMLVAVLVSTPVAAQTDTADRQ